MLYSFISGKGGVGKSSLACALALKYASQGEEVLLLAFDKNLRIPGTPSSLEFHRLYQIGDQIGDNRSSFQYCIIDPIICFQEFLLTHFGGRLKIGATIAKKVLENRVINSFLSVCPGFDAAALLGKIMWEGQEGKNPSNQKKWTKIVIDAPASGHFLKYFDSTFSLLQIFKIGFISKHLKEIKDTFQNQKLSQFLIPTLCEELPAQESVEMISKMSEHPLPNLKLIINKSPQNIWTETEKTADQFKNSHLQNLILAEKEAFLNESKIKTTLLEHPNFYCEIDRFFSIKYWDVVLNMKSRLEATQL